MTATPARAFPTNFLFGAATAAFQIEGAAAEDGRRPSIWDAFCRVPGAVINADNGEMCAEFGDKGEVDLKAGMGNIANKPFYTMTSAPTVAGTAIVVGGRVADNVQVDMPGGVMRAFDVISGKMLWHFDPGSDNPNAPLNADQNFQRSTPNVWAGISYDPTMNAVFLPVGSASVDLYGATRSALDRKYGASVLALDAATGTFLEEDRSPGRALGTIDNRGSHFYLGLYWAQELAKQTKDAELAAAFGPIAATLAENEQKIVGELNAVQGTPVEIGGYYHPDEKLVEAVMRPSQTLNEIVDNI